MEKINLKIIVFTLLAFNLCGNLNAQSYNDEKVSLSNFMKRMYTSKPFEGVKIIDDYDHNYLVSVVTLDKAKYTSESIMNRIAQVKAQSQASTFLNGATISMDMVITTTEKKDSQNNINTIVKTVEQIKQNSAGFSRGLELLSNFDNSDNSRMVYIYIREILK